MKWEKAFEEWKQLLRHSDAIELLEDPSAVWDEAWRQVAMELIAIVSQKDTVLAARLREEFLD